MSTADFDEESQPLTKQTQELDSTDAVEAPIARKLPPDAPLWRRFYASCWGLPGQRKLPRHEGELYRNLFGFFIAGLFNHFAYITMLSAAEDLKEGNAGVVLILCVVPGLILKFVAPWFMHMIPYNIRVLMVAALAMSSFQIVGWCEPLWARLIGVSCASLSQCGGEITFLSMSHYYHKNVVSAWSSGTGAAGVAGALSFLFLTSVLGLTAFQALMIITVIPLGLLFSAFVLMTGNHSRGGLFGPCRGCIKRIRGYESGKESRKARVQMDSLVESQMVPTVVLDKAKGITLKDRLLHLLPLAKSYMIPVRASRHRLPSNLLLLANTVLLPLTVIHRVLVRIFYQLGLITGKTAYKTYALTYQIGVFISRSSVNIFPVKNIWIPSMLQVINLIVLFLDSYFRIIPSIWVLIAIILYEGLLGGMTYVNAFYLIRKEVEDRLREFSLGITSVSDSVGKALAGVTAAFLQPWLMQHQRRAPF